jgi:hypothetical protein
LLGLNICEITHNPAIIGYTRTLEQDLSGQIEALKASGVTTIHRARRSAASPLPTYVGDTW